MLKMILKTSWCAIFIICITVLAVYFDKSVLLWWYVCPLFVMLYENENKEGSGNKNK